jgi:hypothetical protein
MGGWGSLKFISSQPKPTEQPLRCKLIFYFCPSFSPNLIYHPLCYLYPSLKYDQNVIFYKLIICWRMICEIYIYTSLLLYFFIVIRFFNLKQSNNISPSLFFIEFFYNVLHCAQDIELLKKYYFLDNGVLDVNKTSIKSVITESFYPLPVRPAIRTNRMCTRLKLSPN